MKSDWSGRERTMNLGQQGHRVTVQMSHLFKQSMSSRVGLRQVGSPSLTLERKFGIVILKEGIEKLLSGRGWSGAAVLLRTLVLEILLNLHKAETLGENTLTLSV